MTLLGIAGAYLEDSTNEKHFWPKDSKNTSEGYSLWPSLDPPQDSSDFGLSSWFCRPSRTRMSGERGTGFEKSLCLPRPVHPHVDKEEAV